MLLFTIALLACDGGGSGPGTKDEADDTDASTDDSGAEEVEEPVLVAPEYSGGSCPEFVEGTNTEFSSGGEAREFELRLPADPVGAPVVFGWHWLGGTAKQAVRYLGVGELADEGAIVVAPQSCCSPYEWNFLTEPQDNVDLAFFDDLLACLDDQYQVDLTRIYVTGFSAGALWTTYLTMYRSEYLAATAPFSGGTDGIIAYSPPTDDIPVLLNWGGADDLYGPLSFETATEGFSSELLADGHFVIDCDHGLGHSIPDDPMGMAWPFFQDHPKFVDPEPWSELPSSFPEYCWIP